MEQTELIEKVKKFGELIGTLSVVVYAQSCFIETLVLTGFENQDPKLLSSASEIHRQTLRAAMKATGIDDAALDELEETMAQFKKYQEDLDKEEAAFKKRRAAINRGEKPPQE